MNHDHDTADLEPRRARRRRLTQRVAERRLGCISSKRSHGAPRAAHRECCEKDRKRIYRLRAAAVRLARLLLSGADPMGDTVFRLGEPGRKPEW